MLINVNNYQNSFSNNKHFKKRNVNVQQAAFRFLMIYYWILQYFVTYENPVMVGSILYYLFIAPVAVFALAMPLIGTNQFRLSWSMLWLLFFFVVVCIVAGIRGDLPTINSIGLFVLVVFVVFGYQLTIGSNFLNIIFLLSFAIESILFISGWSIYAVVPGFSHDGELWWRVAIFPSVATSAFFALLVFFLNTFYRTGWLSIICLYLAFYTIVFSGLRTALVAMILSLIYYHLVRRRIICRPNVSIAFMLMSLVVFSILLFSSNLLLLFSDLGSESLNNYFFRATDGLQSEDDVSKSVYRTWLWMEHFRIAAKDPVFGVGTYDFSRIADYDSVVGNWGNGSESFITSLYARVGLPSLFLIIAFFTKIYKRLISGQHLALVLGILMFLAMMSYGTFIAVYDFVFLAMLALINFPASRLSGSSSNGL